MKGGTLRLRFVIDAEPASWATVALAALGHRLSGDLLHERPGPGADLRVLRRHRRERTAVPLQSIPSLGALKPAANVLRRLVDDLGDVGSVTVQIATLEGAPLSVLAEWIPQFDLIALGTTSRAESEAEGQVATAVFKHARGKRADCSSGSRFLVFTATVLR